MPTTAAVDLLHANQPSLHKNTCNTLSLLQYSCTQPFAEQGDVLSSLFPPHHLALAVPAGLGTLLLAAVLGYIGYVLVRS